MMIGLLWALRICEIAFELLMKFVFADIAPKPSPNYAWLSGLTQSCVPSPKDAHQAPGFLLLLSVSCIRHSWPCVSEFHNSLVPELSLHPHSGNRGAKGAEWEHLWLREEGSSWSPHQAPAWSSGGSPHSLASLRMVMWGRVQLVARQACGVFNERRICKKMKNKTNTSSPSLFPKENSIYNGKGAHWAAFSENGTDYYQRRMQDHSGLAAQPQKRHLKVTWKRTCVQRKS